MNHQHTNSEDTITTLFVEILMPMSATWNIHEQTMKPLVENQRKPDAIIRTVERYPMAVEVKIDYKRGSNETGEKQASERYLGKTLRTTLEKITSAIVIRLPYRFRTMPRDEIRENLEASNDAEKIEKIMRLNGRVHYNIEMRFNANSLAIMFTEQDTIGVNKLPNVVFDHKMHDYVWTLWCNSTFGLLCHWYQGGKQQQGRGVMSRATFNAMPTLDVRQLSAEVLANAERIFNTLKCENILVTDDSFC